MVARVHAGSVPQMMRVLDLFSGIGGFSLGLERTGGFKTVAFCEIEDFPRRVLASHWPGVPIYHDVRELSRAKLAADGLAYIDVICGGFPCQDISFAGKRAGLEGARSGLWGEYQRLIGELRPRYVLVENVPGLLSLGMGTVCGDLAALGYDAVWDCVPAAAVGAPHRRDRVWIVAHATDGRKPEQPAGNNGLPREASGEKERPRSSPSCGRYEWGAAERIKNGGRVASEVAANAPDADGQGEHARPLHAEMGGAPEFVSDANGQRLEGAELQRLRLRVVAEPGNDIRHADFQGLEVGQSLTGDDGEKFSPSVGTGWWFSEPNVGRVAHGVPARVDRLKGLGNAVVPQIPELIGRAILAAEGLAP
jgi:DNA (cytosine-5)-methyltransferase 1